MNQETVQLLIELVQDALDANETSKGVKSEKRHSDLWLAMTKLNHLLED